MIEIEAIGTIHTPYSAKDFCPSQPVEREEGEARLVVDPRFEAGLADLAGFRYIYAIFHLHAQDQEPTMQVKPPWAKGVSVGLFASRSPNRPARIGISVVRLKKIEANVLTTGLIDVYDGTPLLDIKPYIKELDAKADANYGWIEGLDGHQHLLDHIRGIPHAHHEHKHHHHHHDD